MGSSCPVPPLGGALAGLGSRNPAHVITPCHANLSAPMQAAIVKMMTKYEMWKAAGTRRGLSRWYARHKRRLQVRWAGLKICSAVLSWR